MSTSLTCPSLEHCAMSYEAMKKLIPNIGEKLGSSDPEVLQEWYEKVSHSLSSQGLR